MTAGDVDPSRHVLVPNRPGALVPLADQAPKRGRDDLDELIDDLLPDVDEGPGVFDVALVVIGLALIGWTVLGSGPGWAVLVGLGAFALGVTLPARALVRRFQSRSRRRHLAGQLDQGTLLDVTTSEVSALTSAHAELLAITERMEAGLGSQVREAGHRAVAEVAAALAGQAPSSPADRAYVAARTDAVSALVETFGSDLADPATGADPEVDLVAAARAELDELDPSSSVTQIEDLTERRKGQRDL